MTNTDGEKPKEHILRKTTWSVLPASLSEAGKLAFPECKSPRTVPDDKWQKLVIAFDTWHHILYSDGLAFDVKRSAAQQQQYLNDIAQKIAESD